MPKIIDKDKLIEVVSNLDVKNDRHWNQAGGPDMNHIKKVMGKNITRAQMGENGLGEVTRENPYVAPYVAPERDLEVTTDSNPPDEEDEIIEAIAQGVKERLDEGLTKILDDLVSEPDALATEEIEPIVDPKTGEPNKQNPRLSDAINNPAQATPAELGAAIILMLDQCLQMMTPEVRTRQTELVEVLQLYQAERPTILEKQKRLAARAAQRR